MKIDIATPAMLFPAISLLLLAYTNRFLTLATIIRNFSKEERDDNTQAQIKNLRLRIQLIKRMQIAGVIPHLSTGRKLGVCCKFSITSVFTMDVGKRNIDIS